MERRDFVRMLGVAPAALAASWNLDFAREKLVSQIESDEGQPLPDQSVFYRSLCTECPAGCALRVKVRRGHPIKLEGDPDGFPGSGGLCVRGQAALARLYHPARIRQPMNWRAAGVWSGCPSTSSSIPVPCGGRTKSSSARQRFHATTWLTRT
jgi:anaerobic selenocysteine-containing dehydrogenase